jgi:two-component system phosphate regulon sensor histidine kinase PhoR
MRKQPIPIATVLRTQAIVCAPFVLILFGLLAFHAISMLHFLYALALTIILSLLVVIPGLQNLAQLALYVDNLAQDKRVRAPDLKFLKNISNLAQSLVRLQKSWDRQKQEMETVITEREILVDTLPDILIMTNQHKIIVRTNRAARNIFGQNLSGKHINDVIPNDKLLSTIEAVAEDYHGREREFTLENPPLDFKAVVERFPIPSEGGISIIVTLNDITQLKRIQRMRADFVANASHEIRTPLASIIGFVETLRGPAKDDAVAREEFLKVMADQAERMSKLISDLLSLSKIEMNAHNVPTGKVDLVRLIRSEKQQLDWQAEQKKVTVRLRLTDTLPPTMGDEDNLGQVVRNLLGNAIKYTHQDTEVTVTARITSDFPRDLLPRGLSRAICFSVQDQGEGIPKEHIPRLTERFYRVDSARTRKVGGTGLGLAIVKHVLNRHQGAMVIESEVGKGSIFSVYLPIYEDVAKKG